MVSIQVERNGWRMAVGALALVAASTVAMTGPARAEGWRGGGERHWDGDRGRDWRGGRDRWDGWRRHAYWDHYRYGYGYYGAPRVYYPPPPPVYYAPGPYYPGAFTLTIPVR